MGFVVFWAFALEAIFVFFLGTLGQFKIKVAPDLVKTFNKNKKRGTRNRGKSKNPKKNPKRDESRAERVPKENAHRRCVQGHEVA